MYRYIFCLSSPQQNRRQWMEKSVIQRYRSDIFSDSDDATTKGSQSCSDNEKGWEILTARYLTMTEKIVDLTCIIRWGAFNVTDFYFGAFAFVLSNLGGACETWWCQIEAVFARRWQWKIYVIVDFLLKCGFMVKANVAMEFFYELESARFSKL